MHTLDRKVPSVSNRTSFHQATGVQRPLLFHITGARERGSSAHLCTEPFQREERDITLARCGVRLDF